MILKLAIVLGVVLAVVAVVLSIRRSRSAAPRTPVAAAPRPPALTADVAAPPAALEAPADAVDPLAISAGIFQKLYELAFGFTLKPAASAEHKAVSKAIAKALNAVSVDPRYVPRRPMLLPQLMKTINDEEAARGQLSELIQRDPGLAGNLLKLANSPTYRVTPQPVASIDKAVALLGTEGIRSLVAAALLQPVFRVPGGVFARFPEVAWEHSFRASAAAEAHASVVENADPFAAQLGGMLMGLGTIMVFRSTLDQYATHPGLQPNAATVAALIDQHAAGIAHRIAEGWELSDDVRAALQEQTSDAPVETLSPLGRSLKFGRLAGALGLLRANRLVDDQDSKTAMLLFGDSAPHFERMWSRLASTST